jgi:LPXTG-motif cell wall-anchored protein
VLYTIILSVNIFRGTVIMNAKAKKNKKYRLCSTLLITVLCILFSFPALAAQGDSSGGGSADPLSLLSSSPTDGQKDVGTVGEIKLTFNKNVVNLTVKENNKSCFSLSAADGTKVPIEVIMADDQINPELNEIVSLKPLQSLTADTIYVVKISPLLKAKNGVVLGKEISINFTTAGTAVKASENQPGQNAAVTNETKSTASANGSGSNNLIYLGMVGLLLLAGLGYVYLRRKNRK